MTDKNLYKDDSIQSVSPREFTRMRPGVYCGSTDYSTQLMRELYANSVDEHIIGHGDVIDIEIDTDKNEYKIRDYGQGIPINVTTSDGRTVLEDAASILNTSGKYDEDGVYEGSALGLNGIGMKLSCYLSKYSSYRSFDKNGIEQILFKDGIFFDRLLYDRQPDDVTGIEVVYNPDPQFFTHVEINESQFEKEVEELAALCPNLTTNITYNKNKKTFHCAGGIDSYINDIVGDKEIISNRFSAKNYLSDSEWFEINLTYTSDYSEKIIPYVNYGKTDSGDHITALRTALTRNINKFAKAKKWLKDKDKNLSGDELSEGLVIMFNLKSKGVSYDAQSKTRVEKVDRTLINKTINEDFAEWLEYNEADAKAIVEVALKARKAKEAAKKAREKVREGNKKKEKALKFDSKLADCFSTDRSKCELYVTEGDSASGNLKSARDNEFQAVMPVRGKILNTQKATLAKINKNAEIMTMIEAFGLKTDPKTMKLTYDEDSLRYDKIIIASDADVDGSHIKNLFYTFIWNFCPKLIEEGHIYALIPPLYRVIEGKDKFVYLKDDAVMREYSESHKGKKYEVSRLKGLGEMGVDETEDTLTNVNNRVLHQITVSDINEANNLFEDLMGTKVAPRKEYIKENSWRATYGI